MAEVAGEVVPWRRRVLPAAAMVLAAALVVAASLLLLRLNDANADEDSRQSALQVARQVAVDLTTVTKDTAQQDVDRLLDVATGSFKDQFARQADVFRKVVQQASVTSKGTVAEAGVSSVDGDTVTVLAAVSATVQNADAPDGEQRQYRMKMQLHHEGDRWLVSDLEFVP
ncbi:mammalian cell entry protein [Kutzneria kofuensis]|uniref:Mce-associated membrane protein n=1 Tax=Kutzneria kofuensis TaxID=103725 RepID=A0A7W9KJR5_9PSEU|nr:mammalian cell entry protein [Kutzneria kofuensis]MBB5893727.1 Mce-associated membrane protein [Kutzneria kofuensis]